jgi:hypothetical protein
VLLTYYSVFVIALLRVVLVMLYLTNRNMFCDEITLHENSGATEILLADNL